MSVESNIQELFGADKGFDWIKATTEGTRDIGGIHKGIVNKSSIIPNCRPNFFEATNLYVIILDTDFLKYPNIEELGTFTLDLSLPITSTDNSQPQKTQSLSSVGEGTEQQFPISKQLLQQIQSSPTYNSQQIQSQPTSDSRGFLNSNNPNSQKSFETNNQKNPDTLSGLEIGLIAALIFIFLILIVFGIWAYQKINKRKK